ncbi:pirin family protein [Neptuniibacter sp. QD72_48]|uniref:pirin family protein n=1 Tax=unclassified Neptuniibacter TaxID=2630693 RepID=UPI0039F5C5E5
MSKLDNLRSIKRIIPARDSMDGAGVKLKRSIGRSEATRIDPFLMLDAFSSENPDDYLAGFPPHPHRGFETVTYMLDGHMIHRDHMGNEGDLRAGGVQWMKAGRGVIHEERPQRVDGLMRGFQLWINLPAAEKMQPASYQNIEPEEVSQLIGEGYQLKVVAGEINLEGQALKGPVQNSATEPMYCDLQLDADKEIELPLPESHNAAIYLFEGEAEVAGELIDQHQVSELSEGKGVVIKAQSDSRMLILAGKPIGEPVVQYGPFVMNTMAEIEQALTDYRENRLVS